MEGLPFGPQIGTCQAEYDIGGNLVRLYAKFAQDGGGSAVVWKVFDIWTMDSDSDMIDLLIL